MPSYLDFNSTKGFRDMMIARTLNRPNGPQTFTSSNYVLQNLSNFPNIDPGDVKTNFANYYGNSAGNNLYLPPNSTIEEYTDTSLPALQTLYSGILFAGYIDSFVKSETNLVSIMTGQNFDTDSKLMQFATKNIRENRLGPVFARVEQNLTSNTLGRVRLFDALGGNTATAINLVTGREPLIEKNYKITVAKTLLGKGVDFLQTVAGVEFPFSEIPGDYLSNPRNPIQNPRPAANTQAGAILQDISGVLGSLIGIQRRPKLGRKPSDLMIEYMGAGQKQILFDQLSYSTYAPNYTTTARSQQSSKLFNFVNNVAQGVKNVLGVEAPKGVAYIGDDRSTDVKYAMSDFNGNMVKSSYYLSLMFDEVQASLFERKKNIGEGGQIGGKLTWISSNSRNKLGLHNKEYQSEANQYGQSLSTKYGFRDDSILGRTQELLDSMPKDGLSSRTHVGNVIDQTSRIFREGDSMLSRGSAIKYVDAYGGETGAEFCRVWTKDRSYMNYSDTMKRTANIRKFDDSVMGGDSRPWNINYAPMSSGSYDPTGKNSFGAKNSTNILEQGDGFYAKKYMFSIENLAWRTSNTPGFTYNDLPYCERGNNGGRVMWFPPYDLKISESNNARWQDNTFLGRPEPIYTYQDTSRSGQLSFKVIVDHPSILNLLVREYFKGMTDEESDNYINAFFAGCKELDFYGLILRFANLGADDIKLIQSYLEKGKDPDVIQNYKYNIPPAVIPDPNAGQNNGNSGNNSKAEPTVKAELKYENDIPDPKNETKTPRKYTDLYSEYSGKTNLYVNKLKDALVTLSTKPKTEQIKKEIGYIFGSADVTIDSAAIEGQTGKTQTYFTDLEKNYTTYNSELEKLKNSLSGKTAQDIKIKIQSSCSSVATEFYNESLALRRSYSVIQDIFDKIKNPTATSPTVKWIDNIVPTVSNLSPTDVVQITKGQPITIIKEYSFKDLGWDYEGKVIIWSNNWGENFTGSGPDKDCVGKEFQSDVDLKIYTPIAAYCRQTTFELDYSKTTQEPPAPTPTPKIPTTIDPDGKITINPPTRKVQIDPLKRIIMRTLSECFYFKKLEEDSPVQFKSLKEKLKYFHPGFHSMTPEGLNARLTFLLQCIRPGDTIPIKGIVDDTDLNARNTSFGPPPVCVLRIGDFYHSKIIIRDVNITYDEGIWDLNPEGIGVQPMIANVTMQISFIGGQGLSKPVERLQNALSSNFFANTEMYDERSIATNETIGGKKADVFTKEFLQKLMERTPKKPTEDPNKNTNKIQDSVYIGTPADQDLSYKTIVEDVFKSTESYFKSFETKYNTIYTKYGKDVTTMMLSPTYLEINKYDVYNVTSPTPGKTLTLHGISKQGNELEKLTIALKTGLVDFINSSSDTYLVNMLKFDKEMTGSKLIDTNEKILKPFFIKTIEDKVNSITSNDSIKEIDNARNELIKSFDKVNFIVKNGKDGQIKDQKAITSNLTGFTADMIYKEYSSNVDYIETNTTKMYESLTSGINFNFPVIDDTQFQSFSKEFFAEDSIVKAMMDSFTDTVLYPSSLTKKLTKRVNDFVVKPEKKNFKFTKFKSRKSDKDIKFGKNAPIEETNAAITDELNKVNSDNTSVTDKLNFYRTPVVKK